MRKYRFAGVAGLVCILVLAVVPVRAADWNNSGGNAGRNGLSTERGPDAADVLWSGGGPSSLIAWQPVIEGQRVFLVRQPKWPYQQPDDSFVVCRDLDTGTELWKVVLPYESGDWITWIGGVKNGLVFASRSGNGASVWAKLYALDAETGDIVWASAEETSAGAYDGVVFAPNGDPIVGSFQDIWRISAADGSTVWHAKRVGSVSGSCGACVANGGVYVADAVGGGNAIKRFDLETGLYQYSSSLMPGFTIQNTPMAGPDGTVYFSRTQNNPAVDFFYAFEDTGTALVEKWHIAAGWSTTSEFGVGPDGSVYMLIPGPELARLDPDTGEVLNRSGVLAGFANPRMAIDAAGLVFCSNSNFDTGRFYSFNADLTERWSVAVKNINVGGPALGSLGTIVICGIGTDVRAYRTPRGDLNCDGKIDAFDIDPFVLALTDPAGYELLFPQCDIQQGDINGDGKVDAFDIDPFVELLTGG